MVNKIKELLARDIDFAELVKGSATTLFFRIAGIAVGYIFALLITRTLGAEAMGIYALSLTLINVASIIGKLGLETSLIRFVASLATKGKWRSLRRLYIKSLFLVLAASTAVALIVYLFSPQIAALFFRKPHLAPYFRFAAFAIVPFVLVAINAAALRGIKDIKGYSFLREGPAIRFFAILYMLVGLHFSRSASIAIQAFAAGSLAAAAISFWWFAQKAKPRMKEEELEVMPIGEILRISLPMFIISSIFFLMQWTGTIVLGIFRTEAEVGIFNIAMRVATLASLPLLAINSIAAPKFAEMYSKGDREGFKKIVHQSTRMIFWSSFPVVLILFLFPRPILSLFGSEFPEGSLALLFIATGQFVHAICGSVGYILTMTKHEVAAQNILVAATLLNIVLNVALIPRFGINGAAFSTMFSTVFWKLGMMIYIKKKFGFWTIYLPLLR